MTLIIRLIRRRGLIRLPRGAAAARSARRLCRLAVSGPTLALVATLALPATGLAADVTPSQRLAGQYLRAAAILIEQPPLSVTALDSAVLLLRHAAELTPDDVELWRYLFKVADLGERMEVRAEALKQIVRLDPQDDVARLLRVNDAIERYQTVEERQAVYEQLLGEGYRERLGPAVASRIAADYALLLQRAGDVDGFARWLSEAVKLDPSNRRAVALATGFFRMHVTDVFGEVELLKALVKADPIAPDAHLMIAEVLLEHGAYRGAARFYDLAVRAGREMQQMPSGGMLADLALAKWGMGDTEEAIRSVERRQRELDQLYRRMLLQREPELGPLDLARRHSPLTTTLAATRAAILNRVGDDRAGPALDAAVVAYESELEYLQGDESGDPMARVRRYLEAAWIVLWLGSDADRAASLLERAEALSDEGLNETARVRFDGLLALRRGDPARAIALLEPIAERDDSARLGLAEARRLSGDRRGAALDLYAVASAAPGTVMGVWANDMLGYLLGERVAAGPDAEKLERIAAGIPSVINRFPEEPTLALSIRVIPGKLTFAPYEPIAVSLEIANNAPMPLAIDPRGPLRPQVSIEISTDIARAPEVGAQVKPIVVDVDRRLRLSPGERMVIPVDLRRSSLIQALNRMPLRGATLKIRATTNFYMPSAEVIRPGLLGSAAESPPIRVDGLRLTSQWVTDAMAQVINPDSHEDLEDLALLSHVLVGMTVAREKAPLVALETFGNPRQLILDAGRTITEAYSKLDPASQAWMLAVMGRCPPVDPVFDMAQKSDSRIVRIAYLLYALRSMDDPMIDAARRGDDEEVRAVAEMMATRFRAVERAPGRNR